MAHILQLVREGAGAPLTPEVEAALRDRYYDWIAKGKKGATITPLKVWDEKDGKGLQRKFREIGEHLAKKAQHGKKECVECYSAVEAAASLECPFCPDSPPPGA
ncbi:MAG TPA: hypothetical protein VGM86_17115 [Thermoanaerobaculia bacterium]